LDVGIECLGYKRGTDSSHVATYSTQTRNGDYKRDKMQGKNWCR